MSSRSFAHAFVRQRQAARGGHVARAQLRRPRRDHADRRVAVDEHVFAVVIWIEAVEALAAGREELEEARVGRVLRAPLAVVEAVRLDVEDELLVAREQVGRLARGFDRHDVRAVGARRRVAAACAARAACPSCQRRRRSNRRCWPLPPAPAPADAMEPAMPEPIPPPPLVPSRCRRRAPPLPLLVLGTGMFIVPSPLSPPQPRPG